MGEHGGLSEILVVLAAAVAVVLVFRRLRVTPVLGYLAAGVLIGPHGAGVIDAQRVQALAELGVVFLLFSIGLERSLQRMGQLRRLVFGLGTAQVAATAALAALFASLAGLPAGGALVIGGGLALSSTAVVLRMLGERRELSTRFGRVCLSVLLFQDLAVVPLLALVPALAGAGGSAAGALGTALAKGVGALVVIAAGGRLLVQPLLRAVARARVPELFTGVTLLIALGVGWLTSLAGLSMALGAFLAGVVIAETEFRHQVEGDIEPFRGLLLALFFMTVGMGIDLALLAGRLPLVLALVAALVAGKAGVLAALSRLFGLPGGMAARVGLTLAQGGAFGFVLFALAASAGALDGDAAALASLVAAFSMAATPGLVWLGERAERRLSPRREATGDEIAAAAGELHGHVVIAGYGRVGQTLGRLLEDQRIPHVALDADAALVEAARRHGLPAFFADAARAEILRAAGVEHAAAVVVTLDEPRAAERAVAAVRRASDAVPVLVRARDTAHSRQLRAVGATAVVPEVVEGSLELGETLLRALERPLDEVRGALDAFRADDYARLEGLVRAEGQGGEAGSK